MARTRVRWSRVAGLGVVMSLSLGILAGRAGAGAPDSAIHPPRTSVVVHVVLPGETVWDIARRIAGPGADPRPMVDRLITVNDLAGGMVHAGDRLTVPAA